MYVCERERERETVCVREREREVVRVREKQGTFAPIVSAAPNRLVMLSANTNKHKHHFKRTNAHNFKRTNTHNFQRTHTHTIANTHTTSNTHTQFPKHAQIQTRTENTHTPMQFTRCSHSVDAFERTWHTQDNQEHDLSPAIR